MSDPRSRRHGANAGFRNVSKFSQGTSLSRIKTLVDQAYANGTRSGRTVTYDTGSNIGTNLAGKQTSLIRLFLNSKGEVRTAFPF